MLLVTEPNEQVHIYALKCSNHTLLAYYSMAVNHDCKIIITFGKGANVINLFLLPLLFLQDKLASISG